MEIGQYFTTERIICGGTGYTVTPVLLNGGVAFISTEKVSLRQGVCGGPVLYRFMFQFLRPGKAEIQFANFRTFEPKDVSYEDVISFDVENTDCNFRELWNPFKPLSKDDRDLFDQVLSQVNEKYTPYSVSTLEEDGCLYRFACSCQDGREQFAIVTIFVPRLGKGEPNLVSIERQ
ncbi:hypothetical protein [Parabacteroides sp.]